MKATKLMPSGKLVDLLWPQVEDVDTFDIAHCLARIARFNGSSRVPYSVAQHCVYVSKIVPPRLAAWGLLHDASEAYVGDMSSGLKACMPGFRNAELYWQYAIAERYGVRRESIKYYDQLALLHEQRDNGPPMATAAFADACGIRVIPQLPDERLEILGYAEAEEQWLARFCELGIVDQLGAGT